MQDIRPRAITLHEPWATLMMLQEKTVETRSWGPIYRGPLIIHAGKAQGQNLLLNRIHPFYDMLVKHGITEYRFGFALCVVDLVAVVPTKIVDRDDDWFDDKPQFEEDFGDYSMGRYAWVTNNLRVLERPLEMKGMQGLWDAPVLLSQLRFK